MKGVILQPSYLPWRGYFHLIHRADVFVFFDDVQYTKRDWRNRNLVKGPAGPQWLTVPVISRGRRDQLIKDVEIDNSAPWRRSHLSTIRHCYAQARHFDAYFPLLEKIFACSWDNLCHLDIELIRSIADVLNIRTRFVRSSELNVDGAKVDRLINVCKVLGITTYISGPSARDYIDPTAFAREGIDLVYHVYDYPEYPQLFGDFAPHVTVLDLLFNCGDESVNYIWAVDNGWTN